MKKVMILVLALLMAVAMTACGSNSKDSSADTTEAPKTSEAVSTEASTEAPSTAEPTTTEPTTEEPTTEEPTTEEPTTEEPTTEEPTTEEPTTEAAASEEASTAEAASEPEGDVKYVNFDRMHFWINGVEFVLGESTLQDMIDSGVVPFNADDIENAGNNVKKNNSVDFRIELGKYWTAKVYVLNDTDAGKPANECYICEIYLPNHADETQDILKFDFPLDMTMEQLKANAGEPEGDNYRHYDGDNGFYTDSFKYTKPSTKYYGSSYFSFEYTKGELNYVYINYLP